MNAYAITVAVDQGEAEEFVSWLNSNGHTAEVGTDTGNYLDGVWTNTDAVASDIMNGLWGSYCNS